MRPRLLELTAFGPYPGVVSVDFDALAADGLFLIHGPTGAGKTSLLDGLTYALYGGVPGTRRPDRLRSDHADPRVQTAVALEFSLREDDYRVTRVPPHERAKKSGTGTTMQKAKATLSRRVGDAWVPVAEGVEDVGLQILDLLGLNREQFQQVVVLPQGDFARALRADANERRRLLSSLFHTHRFADYTERLLERARDAEADAAESIAALQRLHDAATDRWSVITDDATLPEAAPPELSLGAVAVVDQARAAVDDAVRDEQTASEALQSATLAADRLHRRTQALRTLAALDEAADDVAAARAALEAARRAAPCVTAIQDAETAKHDVDATAAALGRIAAQLQELPPDVPADVSDAVADALTEPEDPGSEDRLSAARTAGNAALVRLRSVADRHGEWQEASSEAQRHREQAELLRQESAAATAAAKTATAACKALTAEREEAVRATERLPGLRADHEQRAVALSAAQRLPALRSAAQAAEAVLREHKVALNDALEDHRRLLERRIAQMAAELAGALVPGEPCAVCGSVDHPAPATSDAGAVSADAVDAARDRAEQLRDALEEAADAERAAADDVAIATQHAGVHADEPQALAQDLEALAARIAADEAASSGLGVLDQRLAEVEQEVADATAAASRLASEAAAEEESAQQCAAGAARLATALETAFGRVGDPAGVVAAVTAIAQTLDDLVSAAAEHRRALQAARTVAARLRETLTEHGFADADEALDAGCHSRERDRLEALVTAASEQRAAAQAVLDDCGADTDAEAVDLDAAKVRKDAAAAVLAGAQGRLGVVRQAADDLDALGRRWSALQPVHDQTVADAARLRRLADICNGPGNAQRMSLERYVLAAYLEEIAEAASVRLRAMSDGRYTVRHSDERVRGGGASGLSITILDAFTGTERDAGTLSGGETFQASLCLALAVAEVVQRHAGGVHLDTLFIDEGFGALDAEALEQAMTELDGLREGGRLVGVISHVPVLRERIANAVEVRKTTSGSDVRVAVAGAATGWA